MGAQLLLSLRLLEKKRLASDQKQVNNNQEEAPS